MTTITIPKTAYRELAEQKRRLEKLFKSLTSKEMRQMPKKNDLLDLTKLKINGGPKNLSSKFDFYLYNN